MKKRFLLLILLSALLLSLNASSEGCFSSLSFGINEGHTRGLDDSVAFRTSFIIDERLGASFSLADHVTLSPFLLLRFVSKTVDAPPISFYMHMDIGAGMTLGVSANENLSLNATIYTGCGRYSSSSTCLAFIGAAAGLEYRMGSRFSIIPQLQFERSSYQDSLSLLVGAGVRL
ncbi:MAG: hypothetical protein IJ831_08620 [Spirochaetales bacterium]|nr:hypothetical protein [Spirochaetales bacterium]